MEAHERVGGDPMQPASAATQAMRVTYPVGDWFLGTNDGGLGGMPGRDGDDEGLSWNEKEVKTRRKLLALGIKPKEASIMDRAQEKFSAWWNEREENVLKVPSAAEIKQARDDAYDLTPAQRRVETDLGWAYALPDPDDGYAGELQLMEDHRSQSLVYSDLTDNTRWVCRGGPTPDSRKPPYEPPPVKMKEPGALKKLAAFLTGTEAKPKPAEWPVEPGGEHPVLQFREPQQKIHVHLEDMAAPGKKVLWDAVYDLGGQETLKYGLPPEPGPASLLPNFHLICPPRVGPPHWYELTVSKVRSGAGRPHMLDDFVASQTISAYRPDQEPEVIAFDEVFQAKCNIQ